MRHLLLATLLLICLGCTTGTMNDTGDEYDDERIPDEQRLFQEIMDGYEIAVRPAATTSGVIVVRLGLRLNQIIDLDERHQTLTTKAFITQVWKDPSLAWDPSRFNNVRSLRIPSSKVWLPDTFIYNNADGGSTGFVTGQYVVLNYVGEVQWPVPVKLRSSCQVDVKYFPFDDQECILRFGSWIYNGDALSFDPLKEDAPVDLSEYVDNSEWDLLSVNLERSRRKESSCVDPHTDLVYRLHIRRRTFFYVFNVIIPCVMLSVLTLLTFWVPTTSGEKVTLGLSVFLAFSMFMLLIAEEVPASSESVPLIGIYLCCVMTMTSFSVIMAVLIINLYSRGVRTSRAPAWLRFICLRALSVILRVTHDIKTIAESITLDEEKVDLTKGRKHSPKKQQGTEGNERRDSNGRSFHRVEVHPRMFHRTSVDRRHGWLEYDTSRYPGDSSGEESDQEMYRPLPSTSNHEAMCDLLEAPEQDVDSKSPPSGTENKNSESEEMLEDTDNEVRESCQQAGYHDNNDNPCKEEDRSVLKEKEDRRKATQKSLFEKKVEIAEWQRIALVIDRLLFWIFFWGTLTAYLIILVIIPGNKKIPFDDEVSTLHTMFHQS